ncbi:hypothetical protein OF83DRAFT_1073143, partial [Amylostereum chailletii]
DRLKTGKRPDEMGWWLKRKLIFEKPPTIASLSKFGEVFHMWWISMQPTWCGVEWPLKQDGPVNEAWEDLTHGSSNGFVIVIIMLLWWGAQAKDSGEKREVESALGRLPGLG